jgi:hypothetical protein
MYIAISKMNPVCKYLAFSPFSTITIAISSILIVAGIIGEVHTLLIMGSIICSCACLGGFFEYMKNLHESDIQSPKQDTELQRTDDPISIVIHTESIQPSPSIPPIQTGACPPVADNPTTYVDPDPEP